MWFKQATLYEGSEEYARAMQDMWIDTDKIESITVVEPNKTCMLNLVSGTSWYIDEPAQRVSWRIHQKRASPDAPKGMRWADQA
jgi:hypothetical protein